METYHGKMFETLALFNRAVKMGLVSVEGYMYLVSLL